jgi:phospholipid-translocating ATPase
MSFAKCSIAGRSYGDGHRDAAAALRAGNPYADKAFVFCDDDLPELIRVKRDAGVLAFLQCLALCHSVIPEGATAEALHYKAQSADEGALVAAARSLGMVFVERMAQTVSLVDVFARDAGRTAVADAAPAPARARMTYTLLATLDFTSERKRMSVLCRCPDGRIRLFTKGADAVVLPRLKRSTPPDLLDRTRRHLHAWAGDGLRTLVVAVREVGEAEYGSWAEGFEQAALALERRAARLAEACGTRRARGGESAGVCTRRPRAFCARHMPRRWPT